MHCHLVITGVFSHCQHLLMVWITRFELTLVEIMGGLREGVE